MIFQQHQQQSIPPREVYQSSSQSYGAGIHYGQQNQQGFNNLPTRTRAERDQQREQEQNYRNQAVQRQITPQQQETLKALLHQPAPNTTLFQPEYDRFQKDFAAQERQQRDVQRKLKELKYEQRRLGGLEREGMLWERNEQAQMKVGGYYLPIFFVKDELKRQYHADQFNNGKRNANGYDYNFFQFLSLAYNPITLEYAETDQGHLLKYQDQQGQVRGFVRAQNLDQRSNCGYNLLTGEHRKGVDSIVPGELKPNFEQKVQEKDNFFNIKHYALQQQLLGGNQNTRSNYY